MPGRAKAGAFACWTVCFVSILTILAVCGILVVGMAGCGAQKDTVTTALGEVRGAVTDGGILAFKGIPYARPPEGELRFKPPQPAEPWEGTLEALDFGHISPQIYDEYEASEFPQSEDCLTLNVWTPGTEEADRPVMVWIHGGGWTGGSSLDPWYDGASFAEEGDLVFVSMNYRLGALGWLYLEEVGGEEYAESGNLGILDQVMALEWVRDNIEAFGGDPENVTVFGESAGSMSVSVLMGIPAAKGLFDKAIAESGALNTLRSPEYAASITRRYMEKAGVTSVDELNDLSLEDILEAQDELMGEEFQSDTLFGPVIDGVVLPEPPLHAIAKGSAADVALLTGTNLDEVRLWSLYIPGLEAIPFDIALDAMPWLRETLLVPPEQIVESYQSRRPGASAGDITLAIGTDSIFRMPQIRLAEAQSAVQPDTWMYLFTWPSGIENLGACHAVELPFVFNLLGAGGVADLLGEDPPQELADIMHATWISFARSGDPNNDRLPAWPAYDVETRATMQLGLDPVVVEDPYGEERLLWEGVPFDSVVPSL